MNPTTFSLLAAAALGLAACSTPASHIKSADEPDLLAARNMGVVVADQLTLVTEKLLANHRSTGRAQGKMRVAFIGLENRSAEEIRDIREALYQTIDTILVNEHAYLPINQRYVDEAMRSAGLRPEGLFLADGRRRFLEAVTREGIAPDFLLYGVITSMTSVGIDADQRNYQLTLELIDANTGVTVAKETGRVRKHFNK
ncbi:MAG: hypothetical protein ACF8XB_07085 [Planctomycetota bacterium JB042]